MGAYASLDNFYNISGAADSVNKPRLFSGKQESGGSCWEFHFINFWEELVNDHWQIKYATAFICTSGVEENYQSSLKVTLSPNPFKKETDITFTLDKPSEIKLSVHASSGQRVATIMLGKLEAGQHTYKWNGASLSPGIYTVTLQSGSAVTTKKLILSK